MSVLRVMTEEGISKFRAHIHALKEQPNLPLPIIVEGPDSSSFRPLVEIDETKSFSTRMELAQYLSELFQRAGLTKADVMREHGIWTWLAYMWFDMICPVENGSRKVLESARYICSTDHRDYYRHFIAAPYDLYETHGQEGSKLFLDCSHDGNKDIVEQLASRQYIIGNKQLVHLAHRLYWDGRRNGPKIGCTNRKKPGNIRRFYKVVGQLELTYDVHKMEPDKIAELLPREFGLWLEQKTP